MDLLDVIRDQLYDELQPSCNKAIGIKQQVNITDDMIKSRKRAIDDQCALSGYKRALTSHYQSEYATLIRNGALDEECPRIPKLRERVQESLHKVTPFMQITMNPKPGVTLDEMKKAVEAYVKRKMITTYTYVYEQAGYEDGPELGSHIHCHMMIEHTEFGGQFRRNTKNTFKDICQVDNPHCLNIRSVKSDKDREQMTNYMIGDKKDTDKDPHKTAKQAYDVIWREQNDLVASYSS